MLIPTQHTLSSCSKSNNRNPPESSPSHLPYESSSGHRHIANLHLPTAGREKSDLKLLVAIDYKGIWSSLFLKHDDDTFFVIPLKPWGLGL